MTPTSHTALMVSMLAAAACAEWHQEVLPSPVSPLPRATSDTTLHAGFGRADITPAPGVGLAGNGPEGRQSTGYRYRLYARALVLQDGRGERLAFVVADLPFVSPNIHRLLAARILAVTGIGADRLILSATHTHAGPGHFLAERQYNLSTSSVSGYDPAMVDFLTSRMSRAVLGAYAGMRRARATWGMAPLWGHTRNRSFDAYCRDPVPKPAAVDSACVEPEKAPVEILRMAVDPTLALLRVDLEDSTTGQFLPAGGYSVFAIHGTGNPTYNELFDGDIHALMERGLERAIDDSNRVTRRFANRAVHLVANGTEGDVSPDWPRGSRCSKPAFGPRSPLTGPRAPDQTWGWRDPSPGNIGRCLSIARGYVNQAGDSLGKSVDSLFQALTGPMLDTLKSRHVRLARAFEVLRLPGREGLCPVPATGTSTLAGAEDGETRLRGWRVFGLLKTGLVEGGTAAHGKPEGCHGKKRVAFGGGQQLILGEHGLPEVAQLAVVRVGSMLLGAVPAEVTTAAGWHMRQAIAEGAGRVRSARDSVMIVGLANGFIQYVTTPLEYDVQNYEGGSTLYGPQSAVVLARHLRDLAASLARSSTPGVDVAIILAYPGTPRQILPPQDAGPPPDSVSRKILEVSCRGDTVMGRWIDLYPGRLVPADGPLLTLEADTGNGGKPLAWDDDKTVEVRAIRPRPRRQGYEWEIRWTPPRERVPYYLRLLQRPGLKELVHRLPSCRIRQR